LRCHTTLNRGDIEREEEEQEFSFVEPFDGTTWAKDKAFYEGKLFEPENAENV